MAMQRWFVSTNNRRGLLSSRSGWSVFWLLTRCHVSCCALSWRRECKTTEWLDEILAAFAFKHKEVGNGMASTEGVDKYLIPKHSQTALNSLQFQKHCHELCERLCITLREQLPTSRLQIYHGLPHYPAGPGRLESSYRHIIQR